MTIWNEFWKGIDYSVLNERKQNTKKLKNIFVLQMICLIKYLTNQQIPSLDIFLSTTTLLSSSLILFVEIYRIR